MAAPSLNKPQMIATEADVTAGELKVNDAYDLTLLKKPDGNYELQLFMKIQFFFKDDGISRWNKLQQQAFITNWESIIRNSWDNIVIRVLSAGETVALKLKFQIQIDGFMLDHWEITVKKVPPGSTFRSYVDTYRGNVMLTENDNNIVIRHVAKKGNYRQTTSVHEFGHMLGLDDEYGPLFGGDKGAHNNDFGSLMNVGSNIRNRHKSSLINWLNDVLSENKIK